MNKYILEIINQDGSTTRTEYKSLREIHKIYPQFEYFQIRALYKHTQKQTTAHPLLKLLSEKIKIYDNDKLNFGF